MNTWAIWAPDLHLDLAGRRAAGVGLRAALEDALREAAAGGNLPPGTRLPSSRALAADLGLARNTVAEAYAQLAAEGWLASRQGSGTTVAQRSPCAPPEPPPVRPPAPSYRYDLRSGRPDLDLFPRRDWLAATRRALDAAPRDALGYSDPRGRIELRRALAGYLGRVRGVRIDHERLVLCSGYAQGLALLAAVLHADGARTLAVEGYGLAPHHAAISAAGPATVPLPLDERGARTELLPGLDADAVLLTPAHQFPTGAPLHPSRRAAAVDWAREADALVIEDDYDGEFRYDRQPLGAVQALDPDRVVYAGTASKSLAPGLRLGWLALPRRLVEPMAEQKARADGQSGVIEQLALAELIGSGGYDRQVRRARLHYRRRRDRLAAVPADGPGEEELVARAARRGLALQSLGEFRHPLLGRGGPDEPSPALVIGYGTPSEGSYAGALAELAALLAER
ncbi:PLP-dependent aminotransferase family protein [Kitasatospora nipponensis]|uniref:PLP-dependent aminotransferase family protein n=1 Tax=Kitasatospora nipponensis TaxID=258049 RepID=A0ABP4HH19_9ACTN